MPKGKKHEANCVKCSKFSIIHARGACKPCYNKAVRLIHDFELSVRADAWKGGGHPDDYEDTEAWFREARDKLYENYLKSHNHVEGGD